MVIVFINKMDRMGADFWAALASMREKLGAHPLVLTIPWGEEERFQGVIDLLSLRAIRWREETLGVTFEELDIPADYQPPAPPPPKPTPEEVLAEVQAKSIEADIQKKAAELELKREQMVRDDDFRRDQLAQDGLLKKYEIELKYNAQISNAEIQAATSMNREETINQPGMA